MAKPGNGESPKRPGDPLEIPEIAALLGEIREDALKITATSELRTLRRRWSKLAALTTTSMPHSWTSLHALAQEQSRALVWTEQCESKMPRPNIDDQKLRIAGACQFVQEIKSALSPEDNAVFATPCKRGADVWMARQGTNGASGLANSLPGSALPTRNGKELPASSSRPIPN